MSPKTPRVNANQVIRAIQKMGFAFSRQSGSHKIYRNASGRRVTVPYHTSKILHPKIIDNIIDDAGLTLEEFIQLLSDS
jgi:predicted RNA binding protein YcfA (HicA-like mRNA interferase family)